MKLSLLTLALAILSFLPQSFAMEESMKSEMMHEKSPLKAVMFFSENCGSCKILDPRMKEAMAVINEDKLDVVKFDFTNEETKQATQTLAASKGLDAILSEHGPKTGFIALVNSNGEVVDKLTKTDETPEIAAKLAKAIATNS